jgi:hypothetical protein
VHFERGCPGAEVYPDGIGWENDRPKQAILGNPGVEIVKLRRPLSRGVDVNSHEREGAPPHVPISPDEDALHERHVVRERGQDLLLAGLPVRTRYRSVHESDACSTLEVPDGRRIGICAGVGRRLHVNRFTKNLVRPNASKPSSSHTQVTEPRPAALQHSAQSQPVVSHAGRKPQDQHTSVHPSICSKMTHEDSQEISRRFPGNLLYDGACS